MSNFDNSLSSDGGYSRHDLREEPRPFEELPDYYQKIILEKKNKSKEDKRSTLDMLQEKYIMTLILYIDENSPVLKTELYSNISRSPVMKGKIDDIRSMGLIEIYSSIHNTTNVITITEKGKKIASIIREMLVAME